MKREEKFRKKPVIVEAFQFTDESKDAAYRWASSHQMNIQPSFDDYKAPILLIPTLEGEMICRIGDWIIRGINGEFYPCKPDIFEKTYEPATPLPPAGCAVQLGKQICQLKEFHTAFKLPQRDIPTIIPPDEFKLRHKILVEEVGELSDAYFVGDIVEVADAITDCLYVLIGTALQFGIADKLEACFDEVHRSNMSKLGDDGKPIMRKDGKVMKGPNFERPDLNKVLAGPSDYYEQKSEIKMPTELIDNFQLVTDFGEAHKTLHPKTQQTKWSGVLWLSEWLRNQITEKK